MSGTSTIAILGSIVVKGKLPDSAAAFVRAEKIVDFPTFGNPTIPQLRELIYRNIGATTSETIVISLINMFIAGPEVSLNGSPIVSPTTAAL